MGDFELGVYIESVKEKVITISFSKVWTKYERYKISPYTTCNKDVNCNCKIKSIFSDNKAFI